MMIDQWSPTFSSSRSPDDDVIRERLDLPAQIHLGGFPYFQALHQESAAWPENTNPGSDGRYL